MVDIIEHLDWDTRHFGFKVAKMHAISRQDVQEGLRICQRNGVRLLIHRCGSEDYIHVHTLEDLGFRLMAGFMRYRQQVPDGDPLEIKFPGVLRFARPEDEESVGRIAAAAFAGWGSHFHNDPRLDRAKCDGVYIEWARNSLHDRRLADHVVVAELEGSVAGFGASKVVKGNVCQNPMAAVSPAFQRRGVLKAMTAYSFNWAKSRNLKWIEGATVLSNYRALRVVARFGLGFEIFETGYTFHKWFY